MKNKKTVAAVICIIVCLCCAIFVFYNLNKKEIHEELTTAEQTREFSDNEEKKEQINNLPKNMSGFIVDVKKDFDFFYDVKRMFDVVNAIKPNACIIKVDDIEKNIDKLSEFISLTEKKNILPLLFVDENLKQAQCKKLLSSFSFGGIVCQYNGKTDEKRLKEQVKTATENNISFSCFCSENHSDDLFDFLDKNEISNIFVELDTQRQKDINSYMDTWGEYSMSTGKNVYCVFRNDLVSEDEPEKIYDEVKYLYDKTSLNGGVMSSFEELNSDKYKTTEFLNNYYEDFNDAEFTTLVIEKFDCDEKKVYVSGSCDKDYQILYRNNSDLYKRCTPDKNGKFSFEIGLDTGLNNIIIRHRNSFVELEIERLSDSDGKNAQFSPYKDNSLGQGKMCIVTKDYAESVPETEKGDKSDPTYTPQSVGTVDYVKKITCVNGKIMYTLSSNMKIYATDAKLIVNGYLMPKNEVNVGKIEDKLSFTSSYKTTTRFVLTPQQYYTGNLGREFNVNGFESENLEITFFNTDKISCDFALEENDEFNEFSTRKNNDGSSTLVLKLKNKNEFRGYSVENVGENGFTLQFTKPKYDIEQTVVMLDAGHGGPGSPGTNYKEKTYERDVTVDIVFKLKKLLENEGYNVLLTREQQNQSVFLDERVSLSREKKPDIFVSIHCDGNDDTSLFGVHSFYYKNYSFDLAKCIQEKMVETYKENVHVTEKESSQVDLGVKYFPYQVTRIENCPSVLIETGLLTNNGDGEFLSSNDGRQKMAQAVFDAIDEYFTNP